MMEEAKLKYEKVKGIPHMDRPGNSVEVRTGDWRVFRPVWDMKKCVKCRQCWLMCPDAAIKWKGRPAWDDQTCKGCLICIEVCPSKAIRAEREH